MFHCTVFLRMIYLFVSLCEVGYGV